MLALTPPIKYLYKKGIVQTLEWIAILKLPGLVDIKNSDIEYSLLIGKENAI
ncbi:hypothetical protein wHma_08020 [Wolbachia pipientis]|nr:hypothetical protein wHma_07940 [Wolbachia pipientis]GKS78795.1 hypothetical protein wHma_08020 [Wolbachia pipientis]